VCTAKALIDNKNTDNTNSQRVELQQAGSTIVRHRLESRLLPVIRSHSGVSKRTMLTHCTARLSVVFGNLGQWLGGCVQPFQVFTRRVSLRSMR